MGEKDRREQIMRAAEHLFSSRRFHEITIEEIAARAGIGKGTIYRYFKDKDDLFHQTVMHGFEELCALLEAEDEPDAELAPKLLRACTRIDSFFQGRRQLFGMMQAEENRLVLRRGPMRQHWRERRERLIGILAAILDQAAARGELRTDITPQRQASLLLGMLKTVAHESKGIQSEVADIVALFLHGARSAKSAMHKE